MFKFTKTPGEKELDRSLKATQDAFLRTVETARRCFNDPKFKQYMDDYAKLERITIDRLIRYSNEESDPVKFAFGAKDLLQKIEHARAFLAAVKNTAVKPKLFNSIPTESEQADE